MIARQLPEDLLLEIIPRLPKKSQARFKAASKKLRDLIKEAASLGIVKTTLDSGFVVFDYKEKQVQFYRLQVSVGSPFSHSSSFVFPTNQIPNWLGSCNGILFYDSYSDNSGLLSPVNYHLYNPLTKHVTTLPPLSKDGIHLMATGLALPPRSNHYKFVVLHRPDYITRTPRLIVSVFDSRTGGWKGKRVTLDRRTYRRLPFSLINSSVYFKGSLYWHVPFSCLVILSLRRKYSFRALELPRGMIETDNDLEDLGMLWKSESIHEEERLNFCQIDECQGLCIWILVHNRQDTTGNIDTQWRKIFNISYEALNAKLSGITQPLGHEPETLFMVLAFDEHNQIVYLKSTEAHVVSFDIAEKILRLADPIFADSIRNESALPFTYRMFNLPEVDLIK